MNGSSAAPRRRQPQGARPGAASEASGDRPGVAICVNPMAGRDVRRLAARASTMTFEAKRDAVARIAAGADAAGAGAIYVVEEPFRIASMALEWLPLEAEVHVLKTPIAHGAEDTEAAVAAFLERGVTTIVSLGGDGTNRAIARAIAQLDRPGLARTPAGASALGGQVNLIPLSTGTNNVFPVLVEPTVAGLAAALAARGLVPTSLRPRCKMLHVQFNDGVRDVALIDAAYLAGDFTGNMRPFDADRLRQIFLARAEPDAVGMSPIGGHLEVVEAEDDAGLLLRTGSGTEVAAPISPGLFRRISVARAERIPLGTPVLFRGDGVLALDGDRDHRLNGRAAHVTLRRDGVRVVDVAAAMRHAARHGLLAHP